MVIHILFIILLEMGALNSLTETFVILRGLILKICGKSILPLRIQKINLYKRYSFLNLNKSADQVLKI